MKETPNQLLQRQLRDRYAALEADVAFGSQMLKSAKEYLAGVSVAASQNFVTAGERHIRALEVLLTQARQELAYTEEVSRATQDCTH